MSRTHTVDVHDRRVGDNHRGGETIIQRGRGRGRDYSSRSAHE